MEILFICKYIKNILNRVVEIYKSEDRSAVVKVNKVLYPV